MDNTTLDLKEEVRKRDNYECRECHKKQSELGEKLSIHHIDGDPNNNSLDNLISLCSSCHNRRQSNSLRDKRRLDPIKKTSISLEDPILKAIDDFRRKQEKIPTLSEAIRYLIERGLEEKKEIPKEPSLTIPKEAFKLEDLTLRIRDPQATRGGSALINIPYKTILEHGFKNLDKINTWISRKVLS